MSGASEREVREFWNAVADDWRTQVGDEGDINRRLNSDPVLWELAGDVEGKRVLDAGCGTGYLTRKLHDRGAHVVGVDLSEEMIALAQARRPGIDFRVDSISRLDSVADAAFEVVVANYVLMDTPDLEGAVSALHRVLIPGGAAVLVFEEPRISEEARALVESEKMLRKLMTRPYSVAFRLQKEG